jgi:hypothetical protein
VEPRPILRFYRRAACQLCDEGREALAAVLEERAAAGLTTPRIEIIDIERDDELLSRYLTTIPVLAIEAHELPLALSARDIRRFLAGALDAAIA